MRTHINVSSAIPLLLVILFAGAADRQIFEYNGKPDTLGGKIGSYSPFFVYTVDSNCLLNKALTIRYNQKHYVFAGFRYNEKIEVFYPNDGSKPRLWKKN